MSSLELDRERAIQTLCAHYANDHLTTQELEARFEQANRATSVGDLRALFAMLPVLPPTVAAPTGTGIAPLFNVAVTGEVQAERRILALMSEVKKEGEWIPARRNIVRAVMGSVVLDMREALFSPGDTDIDITAIMAEVKLIVPPGLTVVCDGSAIMGEFKEVHATGATDAGAPVLRIRGMAFMGSVSVKTRLPGESALGAWRRVQREKRHR